MITSNRSFEVWAEFPTSTGNTKFAVDLKLFVAISDRKCGSSFQNAEYGFAWRCRSTDGTFLTAGDNSLVPRDGDSTKGIYPALIEGIAQAPINSRVVVIFDVTYVVNQINDRANWNRRGYRRANGRPYADAENMKRLDELCTMRNIQIEARAPDGDEKHDLGNLKLWASEIAQNNGKKPSEWGL